MTEISFLDEINHSNSFKIANYTFFLDSVKDNCVYHGRPNNRFEKDDMGFTRKIYVSEIDSIKFELSLFISKKDFTQKALELRGYDNKGMTVILDLQIDLIERMYEPYQALLFAIEDIIYHIKKERN